MIIYLLVPVATTLTLAILSRTCMPVKLSMKLKLGHNILDIE